MIWRTVASPRGWKRDTKDSSVEHPVHFPLSAGDQVKHMAVFTNSKIPSATFPEASPGAESELKEAEIKLIYQKSAVIKALL